MFWSQCHAPFDLFWSQCHAPFDMFWSPCHAPFDMFCSQCHAPFDRFWLLTLQGLALTDLYATPPLIWYFPASDLPPEPLPRFTELFRVREKWSYDDIEPYIRSVCI